MSKSWANKSLVICGFVLLLISFVGIRGDLGWSQVEIKLDALFCSETFKGTINLGQLRFKTSEINCGGTKTSGFYTKGDDDACYTDAEDKASSKFKEGCDSCRGAG